jgi:energy-coupling factor transporter ATP-binding protein EcfA2
MVSKLIRHLKKRMFEQKMSNFIIIIGKKGSGKSYLSLRLGELLEGKSFGLHHVCFSLQQMFDLLDKGEVKPGDVVMLEEVGVAANSRDAMSRTNKHLSFAAQAIRPARITVIANTISWGLIDSQVKNLADYRIEVVGHDIQTSLTEFKFMKVNPRQDNAEPYKEHLIFNDERGRPVKFVSWSLKKPTAELADAYDVKRGEYLRQIYSDGAATMNGTDDVRFGMGKKEKRTPAPTVVELAELIMLNKTDCMNNDKLDRGLALGMLTKHYKRKIDRHDVGDACKNVERDWQKLGGK